MKSNAEKQVGAFNRIEFIDFFRGMAIICVVLYHLISLYMKSLPAIVRYAANSGSSGVLIFFFCSGCSLYLSNKKNHQKFLDFIIKKIRKIYFPYIIIVLISATIPVGFVVENRLMSVLSHILQFRAFSFKYFSAYGGHFWYLSTLFQLFLIFYILEYLLDTYQTKKFMVSVVLVYVLYIVLLVVMRKESDAILTRLFPKYLIEFGGGMAFAYEYRHKKMTFLDADWKIFMILGVIGIGLLGISSFSDFGRLINDLPAFIGFFSFYYAVYKMKLPVIKEIVLYFSEISYAWYLTHILVFNIVFYFLTGSVVKEILACVISLCISIFIAELYTKIIRKI